MFDGVLQVDEALTGVAESRSGIKEDLEAVSLAPVREAGAMAEDDAGGDLVEARVILRRETEDDLLALDEG